MSLQLEGIEFDSNEAGSPLWCSTPLRTPKSLRLPDSSSQTTEIFNRPASKQLRYSHIFNKPPPPYRPRELTNDESLDQEIDISSEFLKDSENSMLAAFLVVHETFKSQLLPEQQDVFEEYDLPHFPLQNVQQLRRLESRLLTNIPFRQFLIHYLSRLDGYCNRSSARNIMTKVFARELAAQFSLRGRGSLGKVAFDQLQLYQCVTEAVQRRSFRFDRKLVNAAIGSYLSRCALRVERSNNQS